MAPPIRMTAEEFAEKRFDLPDGGRWSELVNGVVVTLDPPDLAHGTVVLNLTKALAAHAQRDESGYACHGLGLIVDRRPDSVWCPAVSWFTAGPRFAESDKVVTSTMPAMLVEVPSSNSRRRDLRERILVWHDRGVELVWVIDPIDQRAHVLPKGQAPRQLASGDTLRGNPVLPGFEIAVSELFAEPEWWRKA